MADWDRAARDRLLEIVSQLREAKVVDFLERTVAHVWRANTDRYEPTEVGDTTRSLGITAAENIRELTLRGRWTPSGGECEIDEDVHVTAPDSSLLIECRGTNLRTCKARSMATLATPEWQGFNWATDSEVRLAAAQNNLALYNPFGNWWRNVVR